VYGGVAVFTPDDRTATRLVTTSVSFKRLEKTEIDGYVATGEWQGKAGGYAIQGRAGAFVRSITGSYSNVVGLSLYETLSVLRGSGFVTPESS
jgi:septum formation protein